MRRLTFVLLIVLLGLGPEGATVWADDVDCLLADSAFVSHREYPIQFKSAEVVLRGRLFVPTSKGPHPAVVLLHGGGRQRLNEAPLFFAPLLARCGIAALVYDKRGTGASAGTWETALFDDFVADAVAAVAMLGQRADIQSDKIGLIGFSQGGRLAPVVAVERPEVAFVVSVSGPFVSLLDTRMYALRRLLRQRGVQGAVLDTTLAAWKAHLETIADAGPHVEKGKEGFTNRESIYFAPPAADEIPRTPFYNSLPRDYAAVLHQLQAPMLAVYGERDALVPVEESIAVLRKALQGGGRREPDVVVIPYADHSFNDWIFKERIDVEATILAWIQQRLEPMPSPRQIESTAQ